MKPYKEIHYNIYCAKDQPASLPPNTFYSRSCAINIITEGAESNLPGMVRYELSIEDEQDTHMLHLNHFSFIRLHPGQKKVYTLTFSQPSPQAKALAFTLEGKFGNVTACLRVNKLEGECWQSAQVKAEGHGFHEAHKRLLLNYSTRAGQLAGDYHLELKADDMGAGLTIGAAELFDSYDSPHIAREIKAGLPLSDFIANASNVAYYTFQLTKSQESEGVDLIVISLTPVSGRFLLAVRNDESMPSESNYQWFTHANEIVIRKNDEFFKDHARYVIAVIPQAGADHAKGEHAGAFRYYLKWSYLDKHDVMLSGVPNYGSLPADKKCFVVEVLPSHAHIVFMKGGNDVQDAFISLGNENHLPQGSNYEFKIGSQDSGVQIDKSQIDDKCKTVFNLNKYCNAYVCLFGKEGSEFELTFVPNNNPITLVEGRVLEGPIPVKDEQLRFIYHPQKTKSLDIEEFSVQHSCTISANIEENTETDKYVWPTASQGSNTGGASIIHVPREKIQNYTNPVILISLSKAADAHASPDGKSFNFEGKFSLEAGGELKELRENKQRVAVASTAMWSYFYFYNFHPHDDIVIGLDSLDGGDADIFVGRGKDSRPTEFVHLERSTGYRSSYIDLNLEFIQGKGYQDLTGYYVVGVKANSDVRYSLYWKHARSTIIKASFGEQHSALIQPGEKVHVLLYNLLKGKVDLVINSHHQPLTVLWHAYQKSNASIPEEFPTLEIYQKKFQIEDINPIALIEIQEDAQGACYYCKYLYTLVNPNANEPIKVEFYFDSTNALVQAKPQVIQPSLRMFGALSAGGVRQYHLNLPAVDRTTMASYYIEVHLLHGEGEFAAKMPANSGQAAFVFVDRLATGFTKVSLKQLADNNQFNMGQGYRGISLTNLMLDITCHSNCMYRMVLVRPEHFTELSLNEAREFFIDSENSIETFVYQATGKEKHFDLNLVIKEFTDQHLHSIEKVELKSIVSLYHVKDKEDLGRSGRRTTLKPLTEDFDPVNGKLNVDYPVVAGFYVVEVRGLAKTGFVYRLEVNTHFVSTLLGGRQTVAVVPENATHRTFEFYPHQPGAIYTRLARCFGDVSLEAKELGADKQFLPVEVDNHVVTSVHKATGSGLPIYLRANKPLNRVTVANEFGYMDHTKNLSIFSIEMFESRAWERIDFENIKPFNEDVYIDLKSYPAKITFRPIMFSGDEGKKYQIRYYVAVSKDPEALDFYSGCDYSQMSRVLKPGYSPEEAVQVFSLPLNPRTYMEMGPLLPYLEIEVPLSSGHRYFAAVFAQISIKRAEEDIQVGLSDSLRITYARLEFEYRSFFYPIELLAATLGLVGLMVASCCVFNSKLASLLKKKLKFRQVSESEVDGDLEDYFMRIKYDYDQLSAGQRSLDSSRVDESSLDTTLPGPVLPADDQHPPAPQTEDKGIELV